MHLTFTEKKINTSSIHSRIQKKSPTLRIPWRRDRKYRRFLDHGIELDPINPARSRGRDRNRWNRLAPKKLRRIRFLVIILLSPWCLLLPKFRADHGGKRETFRNKNWSRYHRSPRWSKVQRWWEEGRRGSSSLVPNLGHVEGEEEGRERTKTNFHKSNVSMDQLSKFFHHPPPGKVAKNGFLPHHPSLRHTFLFTLFPPVSRISRIPWVVRSMAKK